MPTWNKRPPGPRSPTKPTTAAPAQTPIVAPTTTPAVQPQTELSDSLKNKVLLVKANEYGFPKGKKNRSETSLECALRELDEETSLTINNIQIDYQQPIHIELSHNNNPAVSLFVAYANENTPVHIKDVNELNDIKWFTIEEALVVLEGVKNRKQLLLDALKNN